MDHENDTAKAAWLRANLKQGEQYAGLVLGVSGEADYHLVVTGIHPKVTLQAALDHAASLEGAVPSAREMMMAYLNLPWLFSSRERYWTNEFCPAPSYLSGAVAKRDYVYAGRPSEVVPGQFNPGQAFEPHPVNYGKRGLTTLTAVLVRRILLTAGLPEARPDVLAMLEKLNSRLGAIGFKPSKGRRPLTHRALAQNTSLLWTRVAKGQRFELSLGNLDDVKGLSVQSWQGPLSWNVHAGPARSAFSPHTGKQGRGVLDDKMVDRIAAALEELLASPAKKFP